MEERLEADLPAGVIGIAVQPGATVARGEMLVLLESMKMEIPVVAENAGTVLSVAVRKGDVVRRGDLIAVVAVAEPAVSPGTR